MIKEKWKIAIFFTLYWSRSIKIRSMILNKKWFLSWSKHKSFSTIHFRWIDFTYKCVNRSIFHWSATLSLSKTKLVRRSSNPFPALIELGFFLVLPEIQRYDPLGRAWLKGNALAIIHLVVRMQTNSVFAVPYYSKLLTFE